jgi:hypothetical protein
VPVVTSNHAVLVAAIEHLGLTVDV